MALIRSALDPEKTGFVTYPTFTELCAIRIGERGDDGDGPGSEGNNDAEEEEEEEEEEKVKKRKGKHRKQPKGGRKQGKASGRDIEEVHEGYALFTHGSAGPISLQRLRRVARELRQEVDDTLLADMIDYANGGQGVRQGVGFDDFQEVMRRAGVFA